MRVLLCSYCLKTFQEKELVFDADEKTDYCPRCGEAFYAKVNEKRIREKVLQAAYDKLYYDFRHTLIKHRLNDGIFFNSDEQPCGVQEVGEMENKGEGINIGIYIENLGHECQSEYKVSICYDILGDERYLIFKDNFLAENTFYAVMDKIQPELYKLTSGFVFLGFDLSDADKKTINAYFSVEREREESKLFLTGFFPNAAQRIAHKLGLSQHGTGYGIYYTNDRKRIIFTYTEGDLAIKIYNDAEMYQNEVNETEKFYKER